MKRFLYIGITLLLAGLIGLGLLVNAVVATPVIVGGDQAHRGAVQSVLDSQPWIVDYVESVFPNFVIRINYGGHAFPGWMDVNITYWGTAFTAHVAHELGHMVQLAADEPPGQGIDHPAIAQDWLNANTEFGKGEEFWVWDVTLGPWYGRNNPWEAFAENVARAYYAPYYTGRTTPNTNLWWFSRAQMTAFLADHGCTR